tara:strand:+ start:2354 stop:3334 length:981 start_codon:yes stop_codon:yes gene_type:complete
MKYFFTFIFYFFSISFIQAQCSDLFFSEYVEGWSNNKALEIYNPTANSINLSAYSITRYSNGSIAASTPQQLSGTIGPYSTFVIGLDKRDPNATGYDAPMWDGYYTYTDSITGQEVTTYDPNDDLQSKIDFWANGNYYQGTDPDSVAVYPMTMFFNGNDAITLELIGAGIILDIIGKVGEDPGASWTDGSGNYWTKDHTLIRKASIISGVTVNPLVFDPTLEWDSLPANTFINLGSHDCDCSNMNLMNHTEKFIIYPNPSKDKTITISNLVGENNIIIHNQIGQKIITKKTTNLQETQITLPNKNGIYFVSVENPSGIKTQPIIFQ